MKVHPKLAFFLKVCAKNAVNAIITNGVLMGLMRTQFHTHSKEGWMHILDLALATVISREALVWGPKLLAWSNSPTSGEGTDDGKAQGQGAGKV
jgi:hypothetical protein